MNRRFVLDSWAILAFLQKEEPAAARVKCLLEDAERGHIDLFISIINLGEIVYCIGRARGERDADETLRDIRGLSLSVIPASEEAVLAAARLKMRFAVSYADAFAATTALDLDAILVTCPYRKLHPARKRGIRRDSGLSQTRMARAWGDGTQGLLRLNEWGTTWRS